MKQYIIEDVLRSDAQKKLNQWRHDYHLENVQIFPSEFERSYVLLYVERTPKAGN